MRKILCVVSVVLSVLSIQVHAQSIEYRGVPRAGEVLPSSIDIKSDYLGVVRALTPVGWGGFANGMIDVRRQTSLSAKQGDPWFKVLEGWLATEGLKAQLDWDNKRLYLVKALPQVVQDTQPDVVAPTVEQDSVPTLMSEQTDEPLSLNAGQRLSTTLRSWLQDRGMSLSWEAQGSMPGRMRDVSLTRDWVSSTTDLARTLAEALAPFGLSADIVQSSQTVVVRNSTAAQAAPAIQ